MIRIASILAAFAAVAFSATQLRANYSNLQATLASLPAGTQYQIIFVTADTTTATSSNIGDYNSFVHGEVPTALTSLLDGFGGPSASWNAIVSTASVNANSNAPSSDLVFNTDGQEVATAVHTLYGSNLVNPPDYDQNGAGLNTSAWTGTYTDGNGFPGFTAGSGDTIVGLSQYPGAGAWLVSYDSTTGENSVYALSTPITAVPEPASFILLAMASVGLLLSCRR